MPQVTIFSTSTCSWCGMVKKFLTHKGIKFSVVDLDEHPERVEEVKKLSGALSVPITLIEKDKKQKVIIGYSPTSSAP